MNKLKTILIISAYIIILSCSDDDNDVNNSVICSTPTNFRVENLSATVVELIWDSDSNSENFEIEYGLFGFPLGNGNLITSNQPNTEIVGLSQETIYEAYLRSDCSDWLGPISFTTLCDNGSFFGDVVLTTQQEVDDFGLNCYSEIHGPLLIDQDPSTSDVITDLSSLSNLKKIFFANSSVADGGTIYIQNTTDLESLDGLHNLTHLDFSIFINSNNSLTSIEALEGIDNVNTHNGNGRIINISNNPSLISLHGIENIKKVSFLDVRHCNSLINMEGSPRIGEIIEVLTIENNNLMTSLVGLENLISAASVRVYQMTSLNNLNGLNNLVQLDESLQIYQNPSLISIEALSSLESVWHPTTNNIGSIVFYTNNNLTSLNGLDNLLNVKNDISIGFINGSGGTPGGNPMLNDFCALQNLFNNGNYNFSQVYIGNNAYNPTVTDIQIGSCSN